MAHTQLTLHYVDEGSTTLEKTVTFPAHSHHITLSNDSIAFDLGFKFNARDDFATLKAGEVLELDIDTDTVILDGIGNDVDYRLWGYS